MTTIWLSLLLLHPLQRILVNDLRHFVFRANFKLSHWSKKRNKLTLNFEHYLRVHVYLCAEKKLCTFVKKRKKADGKQKQRDKNHKSCVMPLNWTYQKHWYKHSRKNRKGDKSISKQYDSVSTDREFAEDWAKSVNTFSKGIILCRTETTAPGIDGGTQLLKFSATNNSIR